MQTKVEPQIQLEREKVTFTRSDGHTTSVNLIDDILASGDDAHGALLWIVMMKLQELSEIGHRQLAAMENIAAIATNPPTMPDPAEQAKKVWESMGLDQADVLKMMKTAMNGSGAPGSPGVTFEQEG